MKLLITTIMLGFILVISMGCGAGTTSPAPQPNPIPYATPEPPPPLGRDLTVKIKPKEGGSILLNPAPFNDNQYPKNMTVTIDIVPESGWQLKD